MVQGLIDAVVNTAILVVSFGTATGAVLAKNTAKNCAKASARNARRNAVRISQSAFKRQVKEYRQKLIRDAIRDNIKGKLEEKARNELTAYAFSEAETLTEWYEEKFEKDKATSAADRMNTFTKSVDPTGLAAAIDGSTGDSVDDANKQAANWLTVASFVDPTGITGAIAGFIKHSHCESTIAKAEAQLAGKIEVPHAAQIGCSGALFEVGSVVTEDTLHTGPLCSSFTCPQGFAKSAMDFGDTVCPAEGCSSDACCTEVVPHASDEAASLLQLTDSEVEEATMNLTYNIPSNWKHGTGGCNDHGGVTHCKYYQTGGWHRWDIATFSGGIAPARKACGEEAARLESTHGVTVLGATYVHLWGWQYCVVYLPPGAGCPSNLRSGSNTLPAGYYQEWIGRNGHGPLTPDGNSANHAYCFYKESC